MNDIRLWYDNICHINEFENIQKGIEESCEDDDLDAKYKKKDPFSKRFYEAVSFLKS